MKILIAEDELSSRLILTSILSEYGECHAAANGAEAIDAVKFAFLENDPYELICLDLKMPEVNGHEVLREIRRMEEEADISEPAKILMTTGVEEKINVMKAFRNGCDKFLRKPITDDVVREALESLYLR